MELLHAVENSRGYTRLYFDGYKHCKNREGKKGRIFWRCTKRSCPGRVTTLGSKILHHKAHSHPRDDLNDSVGLHLKQQQQHQQHMSNRHQLQQDLAGTGESSLLVYNSAAESSLVADDGRFCLNIKQEVTDDGEEIETVPEPVDTFIQFNDANHGQFHHDQPQSRDCHEPITPDGNYEMDDFNQSCSGSIGTVHHVTTTLNSGSRLLEMVKSVLPPLDYALHKGQAGRIAVVGGSQEYTGAPYFAAISALKVGADLSHVFCTADSASVIKSYSPELIVHPVLDHQSGVSEIGEWLTRMHCLIIGPGLGRNPRILQNVKDIILKAREMDKLIIIDADGLFLVTEEPNVIQNYTKAILTPNVAEFANLYKKMLHGPPREDEPVSDVNQLAKALGNVTVVRKGENDIICDGDNVLVCCGEGSPRRCGGQGDLLSGSMGTFSYWTHKAVEENIPDAILQSYGPTICAAYAACCLTRECNRQAFQKHRRSMTTTDMVDRIQSSFEQLYT